MQAFAVLVGVLAFSGGRGNRLFHLRTGYRWFVPFGVVNTVGIEMLRGFVPIIATHAFVGHTLHTQPWLIQPASIFGIYGLDAVIMLVGYALGLAAFDLFDRRWHWDLPQPAVDRRLSRRWLAATGIVAAAWVALSLILLSQAPNDPPTVRVGGVQHGYVRPGHMDPDTQVARLEALSKGTREAAAQGARLVVWPELGVGFDPQVEHTDELRALAAETGTYILIGYGLDTEAGWRNEAVMLTPQGEFLDVYGKNYPAGEPHIVTSGRYLVYDTPLGRLAPIICNDVNYTAAVRIPARMGAQLVMVPTRMFAGVWKEMQVMAVFRAVENRVSIVMVDGAFRTTMVDPYGRMVADQVTPAGGPLTLVADVPLGNPNDLYTRLGDWVGWFGLAGLDRVDDLPVGGRPAAETGRPGGAAGELKSGVRKGRTHDGAVCMTWTSPRGGGGPEAAPSCFLSVFSHHPHLLNPCRLCLAALPARPWRRPPRRQSGALLHQHGPQFQGSAPHRFHPEQTSQQVAAPHQKLIQP